MSETVHPLKNWRMSEGLTQAEAAAQVAVKGTTWSFWESGSYLPRPGAAYRLLKLTGVTYKQLADWRAARDEVAA